MKKSKSNTDPFNSDTKKFEIIKKIDGAPTKIHILLKTISTLKIIFVLDMIFGGADSGL